MGFGARHVVVANPGTDADMDLVTVRVTGTPIVKWDESQDQLSSNKGLHITAGAITMTEVSNGNSGATMTIDWTAGIKQRVTLTDNCTFTFTAPQGMCNLTLVLIQDGTGSRNPVWPATVFWVGAAEPTWSTAASRVDIVTFYYDGTNYHGQAAINSA